MFFEEINLGAYTVPKGRKFSPAHYFAWDLGNSARLHTIGEGTSPTVLIFWLIVYLLCIPLRAVTYFSHYIGPNIVGFVGTLAASVAIVASRVVFFLVLAVVFFHAIVNESVMVSDLGTYKPSEIIRKNLLSVARVTPPVPAEKDLPMPQFQGMALEAGNQPISEKEVALFRDNIMKADNDHTVNTWTRMGLSAQFVSRSKNQYWWENIVRLLMSVPHEKRMAVLAKLTPAERQIVLERLPKEEAFQKELNSLPTQQMVKVLADYLPSETSFVDPLHHSFYALFMSIPEQRRQEVVASLPPQKHEFARSSLYMGRVHKDSDRSFMLSTYRKTNAGAKLNDSARFLAGVMGISVESDRTLAIRTMKNQKYGTPAEQKQKEGAPSLDDQYIAIIERHSGEECDLECKKAFERDLFELEANKPWSNTKKYCSIEKGFLKQEALDACEKTAGKCSEHQLKNLRDFKSACEDFSLYYNLGKSKRKQRHLIVGRESLWDIPF